MSKTFRPWKIDELPAWVADKQQRAERIRKAKAELEAEAKAAVEAKLKAEAEVAKKREADGRKKPGPKGTPPSAEPDAKAQKNFTDPDSRIMKSKDGFVQAYNAQAAVDAEAQIIVAQDVTQSAVDSGQMVPMTDAVETNLGRKPEQLSSDAGYCSEANLEALEKRNIDAYVATGRARDAVAGTVKGEATAAAPVSPEEDAPTRVEAMHAKIKAGGHESPYLMVRDAPHKVRRFRPMRSSMPDLTVRRGLPTQLVDELDALARGIAEADDLEARSDIAGELLLPTPRLELFGRPSPIISLRPGSKECEMSKFSAALLLQLMFVCLLARLRAEPKHPHPMHD